MLPPGVSSTTFSGPTVHSPVSDQRPAARVAEIRLGSAQIVPVRLRLHTEPFDGGELALDVEQTLDEALRLLVAPLAEVLVADDAVRIDEVERRPVVVGERGPDRVVVVGRDGVVDVPPSTACRTRSMSCSNPNSGVWTPTTISPSSRYARDHAGRTAPGAAS